MKDREEREGGGDPVLRRYRSVDVVIGGIWS